MKQLMVITLTLVLSLFLVACGEEAASNAGAEVDNVQTGGTSDADIAGDESEEALADNAESDSITGEVTYESYYEELNNFGASVMADQEEMMETSIAFSADFTNPDIIAKQAESLTKFAGILATVTEMTPTEDMLEMHQTFEASCLETVAALEDLSAMLNDEFADADDEMLQAYNELSEAYAEKYMAFTTDLFVVVDELQIKLN